MIYDLISVADSIEQMTRAIHKTFLPRKNKGMEQIKVRVTENCVIYHAGYKDYTLCTMHARYGIKQHLQKTTQTCLPRQEEDHQSSSYKKYSTKVLLKRNTSEAGSDDNY